MFSPSLVLTLKHCSHKALLSPWNTVSMMSTKKNRFHPTALKHCCHPKILLSQSLAHTLKHCSHNAHQKELLSSYSTVLTPSTILTLMHCSHLTQLQHCFLPWSTVLTLKHCSHPTALFLPSSTVLTLKQSLKRPGPGSRPSCLCCYLCWCHHRGNLCSSPHRWAFWASSPSCL